MLPSKTMTILLVDEIIQNDLETWLPDLQNVILKSYLDFYPSPVLLVITLNI